MDGGGIDGGGTEGGGIDGGGTDIEPWKPGGPIGGRGGGTPGG